MIRNTISEEFLGLESIYWRNDPPSQMYQQSLVNVSMQDTILILSNFCG
jgi:hypothetical protein